MIPDEGSRRSGRTTRLVDAYIQILFKYGEIIVRDHHDHRSSHERIAGIIQRRINLEHQLTVEQIHRDGGIKIKLVYEERRSV